MTERPILFSAGGGEPRAYYNEIDRDAVHVLRSLIADGLIADGDVDDRSIVDVRPADLAGYTQCHFFAGAGLWSVAARLAGWPDNRPLWTGSCPCQPFSAAGRGLGTDDPRHLWPDFFRIIRGAQAAGFGPPVLMGEQVSGAPGYGWFDGVRADLEEEGFACRTRDIPACAVDAPHIRQRLWWIALADANSSRSPEIGRDAGEVSRLSAPKCGPEDDAALSRRSDDPSAGLMVNAARVGRGERRAEPELRSRRPAIAVADASVITLGDAIGSGLERQRRHGDDSRGWPETPRPVAAPDGRNGSAWSGADWLVCHDGKARRTEPGIRLLVDGMAGRVPAWRLAGNSISPVLAAEVIGAFLDTERSAA